MATELASMCNLPELSEADASASELSSAEVADHRVPLLARLQRWRRVPRYAAISLLSVTVLLGAAALTSAHSSGPQVRLRPIPTEEKAAEYITTVPGKPMPAPPAAVPAKPVPAAKPAPPAPVAKPVPAKPAAALAKPAPPPPAAVAKPVPAKPAAAWAKPAPPPPAAVAKPVPAKPAPAWVKPAPVAKPGPWPKPGPWAAKPGPLPWAKPPPAALWCHATGPVPKIWEPNTAGEPLRIKVLTYNLYWWNLFRIRHGNGDSAGHLIQDTDSPEYDFMGFQECEDLPLVLTGAGLEGKYTFVQNAHALCLAFKTDTWKLIEEGFADIAEDAHPQYFGKRAVQWVRVARKQGGKTVLFVNHHGPLPTNTGGICGGPTTAGNIVRKIAENGKPGDAVILVGDFNSNSHSTEIAELTVHLNHIYNGVMNEGIDNIFTNIPGNHVAEVANLGNGGSDHDALSAIIVEGGPVVPKKVLGPAAVVPGVHGCKCEWAKKPGACGKTDGSPCWATCCHKPPPPPAKPAAVPAHADDTCDCKCQWASKATCTIRDKDASCCWRKCCVSFVKDGSVSEGLRK